MVEVTPAGARPATHGSPEHFTGTVVLTPIVSAPAPATVQSVLVRFAPGARTFWHTHPLGQTLHVVEGVGRVQERGGPLREIRAGDSVWIAPGVEHWHGSAPEHPMTHVAFQERLDGVGVAWRDESVTETAYTATPER
ncbi:MAG: cupin domain-containing protein [Pseudomonadota bacterium]